MSTSEAAPPGRRERRLLLAIVAAAFALRLAAALAWTPPLEADAADYVRLARGLAGGAGYVDELGRPTAWRPPGYPAFLALVLGADGEGRLALALAQAAMGAGVVALTWAVARGLGGAAALLAAALVAADAVQIALAARTLSEGLFTLLSLAAIAVSLPLARALRADERAGPHPRAWPWAAGAGALAGAATLTRGLFIAYPLVLAGALAVEGVRAGRGRRAAAAGVVLVAAYAAVLAPWALRNQRAVGAPVPVATQSGFTLYAGWFPPGDRGMGTLPSDAVTDGAAGLPEVEQSAYFTARTLERLRAEPAHALRMIPLKLVYFWAPIDWELLPRGGVVNPSYLFVLLWAGVALLTARGRLRARELWPLWLPLAYTLLMVIAFYGSPRTRAPVEPLLAAAAAVGLLHRARVRGRRAALAAAGASAAAVAVVALFAEPIKALALAVLRGMGVWRG